MPTDTSPRSPAGRFRGRFCSVFASFESGSGRRLVCRPVSSCPSGSVRGATIRFVFGSHRCLVLGSLVAALVCGCGGGSGTTASTKVLIESSPNDVVVPVPARLDRAGRASFRRGRVVVGASGCLACHRIGANGNDGPGENLTRIEDRLPRLQLARALTRPRAPMPSFAALARSDPRQFADLIAFLADLR
jgi:mono/diheme cytochrome c family protein